VLDSAPPRGGQYSLSVITLSLKLVLHAGSSLRGAAAAMLLVVQEQFAAFTVPSFSAIRSWLLRVGLYALTKPLQRLSHGWVWLIDHTIQIGTLKILVILGCPLDRVPFGERALQLADLQLVALVPMEHSTGAAVEQELDRAVERTGAPAQIVGDQGSDLKKGITDFCNWEMRTAYVPDVAHYGASLLERSWSDQPRWREFYSQLQSTSSKLRQTKAAYLLAPRPRSKARFMNVGVQLRFARRVLKLLTRPVPHEKALAYYGWLLDYQADLAIWQREHGLVKTTIELLRVHGLHAESLAELEKSWGPISGPDSTCEIAQSLRDYVTRHQSTDGTKRFVASSEVLESAFGKLKRLERDQSGDGLTGLVLALGAMMGTMSEEEIRQALEATPEKKAKHWVKTKLGQTMQWLRRQFFRETNA
jgi:hypothetical protein